MGARGGTYPAPRTPAKTTTPCPPSARRRERGTRSRVSLLKSRAAPAEAAWLWARLVVVGVCMHDAETRCRRIGKLSLCHRPTGHLFRPLNWLLTSLHTLQNLGVWTSLWARRSGTTLGEMNTTVRSSTLSREIAPCMGPCSLGKVSRRTKHAVYARPMRELGLLRCLF